MISLTDGGWAEDFYIPVEIRKLLKYRLNFVILPQKDTDTQTFYFNFPGIWIILKAQVCV